MPRLCPVLRGIDNMRIAVPFATAFLALVTCTTAQEPPVQPPAAPRPTAAGQAAPSRSARITLDDALGLALQHNHAPLALRSTILQSQAQEITANLRPNPV